MPEKHSRAAAYALAVLTFINLFNYLDRWVISAVLESIKKSELHPTDTQLGALVSGFVIVYMLTAPLFGSLGDRNRRPPLIALGVAIWSAATMMAGFARSFAALFTSRAAVGVGEAAYGTIAPALLADYFPIDRRGRVFAVFFAAIPVGSAAGYVVGGLVDQHFGWRAAFWVAGAPGLLLAMLLLAVREVPRGQHDPGSPPVPPTARPVRAYLDLLRNTPYVLAVLGYAAYTFALGGLGAWTAVFLERVRGMSRHDATVTFGAIVLVTGFAGTFLGGWLGDWFLRRTRQSYLWVCGIATLLSAPVALVAFTHPVKHVYFTAMIVAEVLVFVSTGPVNSAIVNLVAPGERASAVALSILVMHLLGDVPSPPLMGAISEASSIARAFLVVPIALLISGLIWSYAAWRGGGGVISDQ